jgi:hypothetical protein
MELDLLDEYPVTCEMEVIHPVTEEVVGVLTLTFDANKFTGDYDRRKARSYEDRILELDTRARRKMLSATTDGQEEAGASAEDDDPTGWRAIARNYTEERETDAIIHDIGREVMASALAKDRGGPIMAWSGTRNGQPVEPNYEELVSKPVPFLVDLEFTMRQRVLPKGVRTVRVRTTSDNTDATSPSEPDTPTADSPIM